MQTVSIADALFTKTQQPVLGLLYDKPTYRYYTNDIARQADIGRGTVCRELARLVAGGILTVTREGRRHYYQANPGCPVYPELTNIARKTLSKERQTMDAQPDGLLRIDDNIVVSRRALEATARRFHIRRISLFGSAARKELRPDSDIDILVDFEPGQSPSLAGMVKIRDAFSQLFDGRPVDVATSSILGSPYRKRQIEKDLEELYAA